ncbi:MAG TPA: DUF4388 domain-containing protein [bacterium (Candidatus Stahlbacteria)]|nr:DUF4388 domain-containing protein [Candidatus Stahlbacteria bacterium]
MADLSARLDLFKPSELILFLTRNGKEGCLTFRSGEGEGRVYVRDGRVVHAEVEPWEGMDALLAISILESGIAEFDAGKGPEAETITEEWSELSDDFDRRRVEFKNLTEKLPTIDTVLYKSPEPVDESLSLRRADWQILALIDGERSLGNIVKESKLGLFDALNALSWLVEKGLVTTTKVEVEEDWSGRILKILQFFFASFAGKGSILKSWSERISSFDDKLKDLIVVEGDHLTVRHDAIVAIGRGWWHENLDRFLDYVKNEGVKVYGKILGRKKWKEVEKRLKDEGY